ncbi:hypothetical protein ACVSUC_04305 [Yersinia enterocolitica]|uniref:Uncharacterized protein n=1 Tax=Yersinia enterocolitica TaxID=630 RepID=A0A9P1PT50_YEREN|nr:MULTISPECIES: hypothetical protein [Yersinia]EKN4770357.1 hypothetical protein [Yersinia enterocolitica]EKN4774177.1 hypothetical protein [Yersinia enterocolitica]EKN4799077.1 hypothetical protein [Yersinia enterocolitica]EKN4848311.1 hypothetical protein [Yersinia enterocolitica]EKN5118911.1 hypothetical protein [Yersinia enterocolitica]
MFPTLKVEALAARRMTEQQIADVLDIDLQQIDREQLRLFRESIRKGRAKGEAELRDALYKQAKAGDRSAYIELMKRERNTRY